MRFLNYLESNEKNYRKLYIESHKNYLEDVFNSCFNKLFSILKLLKELYFYCSIIISEVERDTVLFNKVYNYLEDKGFFMSEIEKSNFKNLEKISKELYNMNYNINKKFSELIKSISYQNDQLNLINSNLEFIDGSLQMIDSGLSIIEKNTNDIYLSK